MTMKHPFIYLILACLVAGCEKLSEGVIREIPFPEHEAQIAPTVMLRPVTMMSPDSSIFTVMVLGF